MQIFALNEKKRLSGMNIQTRRVKICLRQGQGSG